MFKSARPNGPNPNKFISLINDGTVVARTPFKTSGGNTQEW